MTEAEWLACTDPGEMLASLRAMWKGTRTTAGTHKVRLFACGCCRVIWENLPDPELKYAVEVAERSAEGQATPAELKVARVGVEGLGRGSSLPDTPEVWVRVTVRVVTRVGYLPSLIAVLDIVDSLGEKGGAAIL